MTIERTTFLNPPIISTFNEGIEGLRNINNGMLDDREALGATTIEMLAEGEYDLVPDYMKDWVGYDMTLLVHKNGRGTIRKEIRRGSMPHTEFSQESMMQSVGERTINMPEDTSDTQHIVWDETRTNTILVALLKYTEGPSPETTTFKMSLK